MSATMTPAPRAAARPLHTVLNLLVIQVLGRPWTALWLALYPQARPAVLWTLREEIATAPSEERWRRALGFFAQLPRFAAAQSEAEGNPSTRTGGEPPEPPRDGDGAGNARSLWRAAGGVVGWTAAIALIVLAVVMWLRAFGTLFDLLDNDALRGAALSGNALSGDATGALAVMIAVATLPLLLIHERRRFAWTPLGRGEAGTALLRFGWRAALVAFGLLALVVWLRTMGAYFESLGEGGVVEMGFSAALGLAVMAGIAAAPLGYAVRRRHWSGGPERPEAST